MDGCFVQPRAGAELRVLGIFGLRPDRDGFSAVEIGGAAARPARAAPTAPPLFSPVLPGGSGRRPPLDRRAAEELLELGWRTAGSRRAVGQAAMTDAIRSFMDKKAVAQVLEQIAAFLELKGENPFRIRAFRTAARAVGSFPGRPPRRPGRRHASPPRRASVRPRCRSSPRSSPPAGPACSRSCASRSRPGWSRCSPSPGSASPRSARSTTCSTSTRCPSSRRRRSTAGWPSCRASAPRPRENILKGIAYLRQASAYRLLHHAADEAEGLRRGAGADAGRAPGGRGGRRAAPRRGGAGPGPGARGGRAARRAVQAAEPAARRARVRGAGRPPADAPLRRRGERADRGDDAGELRRRAGAGHRKRGAPAGARGARGGSRTSRSTGAALWRGSAFVPTPDEAAFYAALGLDYIPARAARGSGRGGRRGRAQLPAPARAGRPARACSTATRGYSDGSNTVEELALACRAAGYQYVGITDHSQAAAYAGGLARRTTSPARRTRSTR